jgi:hypothetical protein
MQDRPKIGYMKEAEKGARGRSNEMVEGRSSPLNKQGWAIREKRRGRMFSGRRKERLRFFRGRSDRVLRRRKEWSLSSREATPVSPSKNRSLLRMIERKISFKVRVS